MTIKTATNDSLNEAALLLQSGECVAIPTETVYGLAANALDPQAVTKIYAIKGRPDFNPLIVHFYDIDHAIEYVDLSPEAQNLATAFWPGPLTMIVNRRIDCRISNHTTAGLKTVAIRVPSHPTARKIIKLSNLPLAAPSANASGEVSPTNATHVFESLGDKVKLIIADGKSSVGLESTVIDMTGEKAVILRPGAITADDCFDILGYRPEIDNGKHDVPKSPGQLLKHYAPKKKVRLRAYDVHEDEALIGFGSTKFMPIDKIKEGYFLNLSETGDLFEAASNLFSYLRILDNTEATSIAVMDIPNFGIGIAMNDRLKRAAEK